MVDINCYLTLSMTPVLQYKKLSLTVRSTGHLFTFQVVEFIANEGKILTDKQKTIKIFVSILEFTAYL